MLKIDPIKINSSARQQLSIFLCFLSLAHTLCQFWLTEVMKYAMWVGDSLNPRRRYEEEVNDLTN